MACAERSPTRSANVGSGISSCRLSLRCPVPRSRFRGVWTRRWRCRCRRHRGLTFAASGLTAELLIESRVFSFDPVLPVLVRGNFNVPSGTLRGRRGGRLSLVVGHRLVVDHGMLPSPVSVSRHWDGETPRRSTGWTKGSIRPIKRPIQQTNPRIARLFGQRSSQNTAVRATRSSHCDRRRALPCAETGLPPDSSTTIE